MPYYIYCSKCNENGSYDNVDLDCGRCSGTGNDWREDYELENYHQRFNISLEELKKEKVLSSNDGTKLFYVDELPTLEEARAAVKNLRTPPSKYQMYDYYIEPCQLCITRNGSTHDICGWCNDKETFYSKRDIYAGNYIKLAYGGACYPYHEIPHITRRYYKDNMHLEKIDGQIPPDVNDENIAIAHARNEATERLLDKLESSEMEAKTFFGLDDSFDEYLKKYKAIIDNSDIANNREEMSSDIDMNSLAISFESIENIAEKLKNIKELCSDTSCPSSNLQSFAQNNIESIKLLELANHEYFHLFQIMTYQSCSILYDAFRRILDFKLNLLANYIQLGGSITIGPNDNILSLLPRTEELDEGSFESLVRWFSLIKKPIDTISYFFDTPVGASQLRVIDLVEGQAFYFQKLKTMDVDTFTPSNNSPYRKAFLYFQKQTDEDEVLFLMFCHFSLKFGYVEQDSMSNLFPNPVEIFEFLCSISSELAIEIDAIRPRILNSSDPIRILNSLGVDTGKYASREGTKLSIDNSLNVSKRVLTVFGAFAKILDEVENTNPRIFRRDKTNLKNLVSVLDQEKLYILSKLLELMNRVESNINEYFRRKRIDIEKYKSSCCNIDNLHENKIKILHSELKQKSPLFSDDIFFAVSLIHNELLQETLHKPLMEVTFESFFENMLDATTDRAFGAFVNDFERFMDVQKDVFCCPEHGMTNNTRDILNQNDEECFSNRFELIFGIPLHTILA